MCHLQLQGAGSADAGGDHGHAYLQRPRLRWGEGWEGHYVHLHASGITLLGLHVSHPWSMYQALYWAIITMTSVGYGDIAPTTWFGKLVGSGKLKNYFQFILFSQDVISLFQRAPSAGCSASPCPSPSLSTTSTSSTRRPRSRRKSLQRRKSPHGMNWRRTQSSLDWSV